MWATFGFALMVPTTLFAGHRDRRLLAGVDVWSKPFKFALSLAIHFPTFAVIARCLSADERQRIWIIAIAAAPMAAGVCELAYIALQAARGRHSHFNNSTPVEAVAAALMGVGALDRRLRSRRDRRCPGRVAAERLVGGGVVGAVSGLVWRCCADGPDGITDRRRAEPFREWKTGFRKNYADHRLVIGRCRPPAFSLHGNPHDASGADLLR